MDRVLRRRDTGNAHEIRNLAANGNAAGDGPGIPPGTEAGRDVRCTRIVSVRKIIGEDAPAIEIHDLQKTYNGFHAVDGLSVTVPQRFFGFLGPNGAGKTTTIKMLMGLAQPDAGSMRVLGMPLPEKSLEIRQQIGLVPDDSLLFDYLTGVEYLEFVARLYGLSRAQAKERSGELLELFQLNENRKKLIGEYSKGMRKRVAMAAALIHGHGSLSWTSRLKAWTPWARG